MIVSTALRSAAPFADSLGSAQATLHHVDCPKEVAHASPVRPHADFERLCKQLKSETLPVKRFKLCDYMPLSNGHDALAQFCGIQEPPSQPTEAIEPEPHPTQKALSEKPSVEVTAADLDKKLMFELATSEHPGPVADTISKAVLKAQPVPKTPKTRVAEEPKVENLSAKCPDMDGAIHNQWHCEIHSPLWASEATLAVDMAKERSKNRTSEARRRPLPACAIRPTGYRNTGEMRVARSMNFGARARLDEYVNEKKPEYKAPRGVEARKCPLVLDPREAHPSRTFGVIPSVNLQIT